MYYGDDGDRSETGSYCNCSREMKWPDYGNLGESNFQMWESSKN